MGNKTTAARQSASAKDPRDAGKTGTGTERNPLAPPGASADDHKTLPATLGEPPKRERKRFDDADPLVTVRVARGFNLTLDHGPVVRYEQGVQEMPKSHSEHWYAKHHLADDE